VPRTRTARKADRASKRKQARNRSIKSSVKTYITRMEKLIYDNDLEKAQEVAKTVMSTIDKAAQKKILHPNTAGRQKSRLTTKLNKALSAGKTEAKPAAAAAKAEKTTKTKAKAKTATKTAVEATEAAEENTAQEA
jgi:small subunit ribosomal protein S20